MPWVLHTLRTIFGVFLDALTFIKLCFRPTTTVAAENLFLRKQLGLFINLDGRPMPSALHGSTILSIRPAECPHHRQTQYVDPLA